MEITIKIDAAPRLLYVLERIAGMACCVATEDRKEEPVMVETPVMAGVPKEKTKEEPTAAPEPEPKEERKEEPDVLEISDDEMRTHMDIAIAKFAGNGFRESKDNRTMVIRRGCATAFKEIAKWLGAEKPTALPQEERGKFIRELKNVTIEEKEGAAPVIVWVPF